MATRAIALPGAVSVFPSRKVALSRDLPVLMAEMDRLGRAGALPVTVDPVPGRFVVHTQQHVASLALSSRADAYVVAFVSPLSFRDHERLLRGALLVHAPYGWRFAARPADLPAGANTYWNLLTNAWTALGIGAPAVTMPPAHTAYLDLLAELVAAGREIEINRQRALPPMAYRQIGGALAERHSARSIYDFHLVRPVRIANGTPVYLTDEPELRGRVHRVHGREMTIRFDAPVDYGRIPHQGALAVLPNDRVYRAQAEAIEALRDQRTANPRLLATLVDRRWEAYRPDPAAEPREPLDPAQLDVFRRAVTVPDQLLVLGPPGTGKTRTITEIAAACVARGQHVLLTSHTNRAVDNVLERLPDSVRAIRVGNEDAMTARARSLMVGAQVEVVQRQIRAATDAVVSRLSPFAGPEPLALRWQDYLVTRHADAVAADREIGLIQGELDLLIRRIDPPLWTRRTEIDAAIEHGRRQEVTLAAALATAEHKLGRHDGRSAPGLLFRWLAGRARTRVQTIGESLTRVRSGVAADEKERIAAQAALDRALLADADGGRLVTARDASTAARRQALDEVTGTAATVRDALRAVAPPIDGVPGEVPDDLAGAGRVVEAFGAAVRVGTARAALIGQWRARIEDPGEDLDREMVRYADVVAATCIGTATSKLLTDLEFDVAIVDEAGQISTPNLLVPLIRSKRAVIVGDHHQLPPYLDDEVEAWADGLARSGDSAAVAKAAAIGDELRRSAFERLYVGADDSHRAILNVQRRMPEPLARFVSAEFYRDLLRTEHPGGHHDPIFREPFAMINTADRTAAARAERTDQRDRSGDSEPQRGYANELEASLIAALISEYRHWYPNWAVIVPYRRQVDRVIEVLTKVLGDTPPIAESVGTVDSFQGGERDLIVYGFTRSNPDGHVGFLKELRRLNVAITRARRQLILIGDVTTLHASRDAGFGRLARAMTDYLGRAGDLRASREVQDELARMAKARG